MLQSYSIHLIKIGPRRKGYEYDTDINGNNHGFVYFEMYQISFHNWFYALKCDLNKRIIISHFNLFLLLLA